MSGEPITAEQILDAVECESFCLRLRPGCEAAYKASHDALWPEVRNLLLASGVIHYEIVLHRETGLLFGQRLRWKRHGMAALQQTPVMQAWQKAMTEFLEADGEAPACQELVRMFLLTA